MAHERVHLAPGVPDLGALGVREPADLLDDARLPCARAIEIARDGAGSLVRMPLPGTVHPDGLRRDLPRGAGTGWLRLRRWRGGAPLELLRARFTAPRSASLAERAWNVACHLRANGVGTPDLVAVGASGRGLFARRSFLLTRELDGFESLKRFLAQGLSFASRRRAAVALGRALGRALAAGVVLPRLDARSIFVSIEPDAPEAGGGCLAESGGPRKNLMPSIVLAALEDARIEPRAAAARARELLARLDADAGPAPAATPWLRARVAALALSGAGLDRAERRRAWRALARATL